MTLADVKNPTFIFAFLFLRLIRNTNLDETKDFYFPAIFAQDNFVITQEDSKISLGSETEKLEETGSSEAPKRMQFGSLSWYDPYC